MSERPPGRGASEVAFELHGVRVAVSAPDDDDLAGVLASLPPEATPCPPESAQQRFAVVSQDGVGYQLVVDGIVEATGDRALALGSLDALLRMHVAVHARDRIFVHAGVVGHRDRAIVLPSPTMTGKTTLVAALVQAGAVYYSDEYAVLDERGLVHPYAKPLSIRGADYYSDVYAADAERGAAELAATERAVESLGGAAGAAPLPVGLIAITRYRPGAVFRPRQCSAGEGSLALLSNTVPARERPAEALAVIARAVEKALVLDGERGDAAEAASVLLAKAAESAHA